MREKRYTVGEMASLCNLSRKQLRYYDDNGILSPRYRDDKTGYRYYTEAQIEEILLLQELRALDFPLHDVGRMIESRDLESLQQALESRLYDLREELAATRLQYDSTVDILLRIQHGRTYIGPGKAREHGGEVAELTGLPPRPVVYTRYESHWNAKDLFLARRTELLRLARELDLKVTGANMAVFHSGYHKQFSDSPGDQSGDLEVCIGILGKVPRHPSVRTLGGFSAVTGVHTGHYRHMQPTYRRLESWAAERGHRLSGISIEEYVVGASMTNNSDDYVTRLYLPLEGSTV